jgi:hypothetical protein
MSRGMLLRIQVIDAFSLLGNHETTTMNKMYGFSGEITQKYSADHYEVSQELFCEIPLAHVIFNKVFVVHGGLSTTPGFSLETIRKERRNREPPESGMLQMFFFFFFFFFFFVLFCFVWLSVILVLCCSIFYSFMDFSLLIIPIFLTCRRDG